MYADVRRHLPLSSRDAAIARASKQLLARLVEPNQSLHVHVLIADSHQKKPIELPADIVSVLIDILETMASGRGVTLIPENAELTTVEAATVLNISRPFLIKLLEEGKIPYRKVGKHRRMSMEDILAFKSKSDYKRELVLDELATQAQELGMYPKVDKV